MFYIASILFILTVYDLLKILSTSITDPQFEQIDVAEMVFSSFSVDNLHEINLGPLQHL